MTELTQPTSTSTSGALIISLTDAGRQLANRLLAQLDGYEHWHKPAPFASKVQEAFVAGKALVFVCASGIVVRTLASVLVSKRDDPPVLVMDEQGRHVIALLSGHEGGANAWAAQLAVVTGGEAVITSSRSYLNPVYTVGMGCARGCTVDHLWSLLSECLSDVDLTLAQISSLGSIDIKADEQGLIQLAGDTGVPYSTFTVDQLSSVENQLSTKSDYVFQTVGVYGVAESAALVAAAELTGQGAELVLSKQKSARATCAIARSYPA